MKFLTKVLPPVVVLLVVAAGLQAYVQIAHVPKFMLPPPSAVLITLATDRWELLQSLWTTAEAALIGFSCSVVVGMTAAVILAASPWIRRAFYPYTLFFQTVPIVAIAPLLVIWFDAGLVSVSLSAFIVSVFPVIANTLAGLLSTEPALLDLFKLYRAGPIQRLWKLRLPYALPNIITGLRVAAGLAVIGTIVGEFVAGTLVENEGLGVKIVGAMKTGHTDKMFAAVLIASLLGLALFAAVNGVGHLLLRRWHASLNNKDKFMRINWIAILLLMAGYAVAADKVQLTLDWKPEPEFGGFYAAQQNGAFVNHGLDVTLKSAGEGAPTWQLVATGKTQFATTAADQVLIARSQDADVVALFTVYQTFPQGIMVHQARGFTKIDDIFNNGGTLAAEDDTWLHFCLNKFPSPKVKITSYSGGVAAFLAKPDYSQQCFVTSEPILAKNQGGDPQTFLIADAGYNPYTTVVIAKRETIRNNPALVKTWILACREGWRAYLDDPKPANLAMGKLNSDMDAATFAAAAEAQKPLIETTKDPLGSMTAQRWEQLAKQLVELKVINQAPPATDCFVDIDSLR